MPDLVIQTRELRKSYDGAPALRGVDISVPAGSTCGFLGPNGAGKTTMLKLLMGILRADAGEIRLFADRIDTEADSVAARRRIGFVTEDKQLYPFMSVGQLIRFTRPFFPSWSRDLEQRYLALFELPRDRAIPKLSKGMRTKLMLLLALARQPELLILDEPTDGLDPAMREDILETLAGLAAGEGVTVFLSSHQLPEVEHICDRVCLIDNGRIILADGLDLLNRQYRRISLIFEAQAPKHLLRLSGVDHVARRGRRASILAHHDVESVVERARKLCPESVEVHSVTLKEIFLDHVRVR